MQVPITFNLDVPDQALPGPPGPQGPAGPAGAPGVPGVAVEQGEWVPVIGGLQGQQGQTYRYQTGHYLKIGRFVQWWAYTQFFSGNPAGSVQGQGSILGALNLQGLPFATATVAGFFGGGCAYSSNLSPHASDLTELMVWTSGARRDWNLYGRIQGNQTIPRPLVADDINQATQLVLYGSFFTD